VLCSEIVNSRQTRRKVRSASVLAAHYSRARHEMCDGLVIDLVVFPKGD
jgi:hypothetical protein